MDQNAPGCIHHPEGGTDIRTGTQGTPLRWITIHSHLQWVPRKVQHHASTVILRNEEGGQDCQQATPHCVCLEMNVVIRSQVQALHARVHRLEIHIR